MKTKRTTSWIRSKNNTTKLSKRRDRKLSSKMEANFKTTLFRRFRFREVSRSISSAKVRSRSCWMQCKTTSLVRMRPSFTLRFGDWTIDIQSMRSTYITRSCSLCRMLSARASVIWSFVQWCASPASFSNTSAPQSSLWQLAVRCCRTWQRTCRRASCSIILCEALTWATRSKPSLL